MTLERLDDHRCQGMLRRQVMQGPKRLGDVKKGVGQLEQPFEKHHVHGCSNHTERRVFGVGNT